MNTSHLGRSISSPAKITHGRHCVCSACAREDWTNPDLAPCGMHGEDCPALYQPLGAPGTLLGPGPTQVLTCCFVHCDAPAVVWLSVARDHGDPLCGKHADELKAYIAAKVEQFCQTPLRGRSARSIHGEVG